MTLTRLLTIALTATLLLNTTHATEEDTETPNIDANGWTIVTTDKFTAHFPTAPKILMKETKTETVTTYSSLDSSSFPVVMYSFAIHEPKEPVKAEQVITSCLEKLATPPSNLIVQDVTELGNGLMLDTICSDSKSRVMRCERVIITDDKIYVLTSLFFPNSAENHEYFVHNFSAH